MNRRFHILATLAIASLGAAPASAANEPSGLVAYPAALAAGVTDLGAAPPGTPVRLALTLRYRNAAELAHLVAAQSDPASPLYRHWLTNAQFNDRYAPAPSDYARAMTVLRANGFAVAQTYANRTVLDVTGSVGTAERFFSTSLHGVRTATTTAIANVTSATIPASLRDVVFAASGLSTLQTVGPDYATIPPSTVAPSAADRVGPPLRGPVSSVTDVSGFGPYAFAQAYDFPEQHAPVDGSGRTAGIVIDADFLDTDLDFFLKYFHISRPNGARTHRVLVDGGPPPGLASGDSIETTLDVETIVAGAPGANLYVYEFPSFQSDAFITDAYALVDSDDIVDTANSSFGGCERAQRRDDEAWDQLAMQGAAKGITFHASSGDRGAAACEVGVNSVEAPASGAYFTAIGGTSLTVDAHGHDVSETVWDTRKIEGTGGGVSVVFPLPSWQVGVPNVITSGRNIPDISFDADPYTGTAFYYGSSWDTPYDPLGGTSLSSPLFGAALTEIDQYENGRTGLAGAQLYAFFAANGYENKKGLTLFNAISVGCNRVNGRPGYCANGSYSQATGVGSPEVWDDLIGARSAH
jgi:subtilase family serine protease